MTGQRGGTFVLERDGSRARMKFEEASSSTIIVYIELFCLQCLHDLDSIFVTLVCVTLYCFIFQSIEAVNYTATKPQQNERQEHIPLPCVAP